MVVALINLLAKLSESVEVVRSLNVLIDQIDTEKASAGAGVAAGTAGSSDGSSGTSNKLQAGPGAQGAAGSSHVEQPKKGGTGAPEAVADNEAAVMGGTS